VPIITKTT